VGSPSRRVLAPRTDIVRCPFAIGLAVKGTQQGRWATVAPSGAAHVCQRPTLPRRTSPVAQSMCDSRWSTWHLHRVVRRRGRLGCIRPCPRIVTWVKTHNARYEADQRAERSGISTPRRLPLGPRASRESRPTTRVQPATRFVRQSPIGCQHPGGVKIHISVAIRLADTTASDTRSEPSPVRLAAPTVPIDKSPPTTTASGAKGKM